MKSIKLIFSFLCLLLAPRRNGITHSQKVLLIFQSPQYYGTHTYFKCLTEYLTQRGLTIHLVVAEDEINDSVMKVVEKYKITMTVFNQKQIYPIYHRKGQSLKSRIYFVLHGLKQLTFLMKIHRVVNPKFTYISVGYPFIWFVGLLLPGKIFYIQNVMPGYQLDEGNASLLRLGLLLKHPKIIAVSDFCRARMAHHWHIPATKIKMIYYYYVGVEIGKVSSDKVRILSLARADEVKNPVLWAEIGNKITAMRDDVVFIWAGDGNALKEAKSKVNDPTKVQFIGYREDVPECYANADIFFTPARSETGGISVVGAMFHGLPVVTTDTGGTVESVVDGETGFVVDVTNQEQVIDRLMRLIDSKALRDEMGKKGKMRFEQLFTKAIWTKSMDDLLGCWRVNE